MLKKHGKKKEKRRHSWEVKADRESEREAEEFEAFLSGNSISCVVDSDERHWKESMRRTAETPRVTFTFFFTGFKQRAENMIFCQLTTVTKASLWKPKDVEHGAIMPPHAQDITHTVRLLQQWL